MNREGYFEDNDEFVINFGIRDIRKGIRRLWWLGVILIIVCAASYAGYAWKKFFPLYQASAAFTIEINHTGTVQVESTEKYNFDFDKEAAVEAEKIFSDIISSSRMRSIFKEEWGTDQINGTISAKVITGTNILSLSATSSRAQDAYGIIGTVAAHFQEIAQYVIGDFDLTMIQEPVLPENPCNRISMKKKVLTGGAVGLAIWCLAVFLYVITRNTVRREMDIPLRLDSISFGSLPLVPTDGGQIQTSVLSDTAGDSFGFCERLDSVVSRFVNNIKEHGDKIILVTSTSCGEGKSTVVIHFASALARRNYRVLVIDADLRKQGLKDLTGKNQDNLSGLVDYFRNEKSAEELISYSEQISCDVISGRCLSDDLSALEVLGSAKIGNLLEMLSDRYDFILLDTSPCGKCCDALEVARYVDSVLFVIRDDWMKISRIREAMESLSPARIRLAGCILNGAALKKNKRRIY